MSWGSIIYNILFFAIFGLFLGVPLLIYYYTTLDDDVKKCLDGFLEWDFYIY